MVAFERNPEVTSLEKILWGTADQFRANSGLKAQEYSGPIHGLIFLRLAIIATATRKTGSALPTISYQGGSLENKIVRDRVCEILEGGERAFLERERRYRLRWDEAESVL